VLGLKVRVDVVGEELQVCAVDGDPRWQAHRAGMVSGAPEEHEELALGVEHLDVLKGGVHDVDDALAVQCQVLGADEVARRIGDLAELHEDRPVGAELLEAAANHVGDVDGALAVHRDPQRTDEPAQVLVGAADRAQGLATKAVQNEDALGFEVRDQQLVTADRDPGRDQPALAEGGDVAVFGVEDEDPAQAAVHDVLEPVGRDRDVRGLDHLLDASGPHEPCLALDQIEDHHTRVRDVADVYASTPHRHSVGLADGQDLVFLAEDELVEGPARRLHVGAEGKRAEELDSRLVRGRWPEGVARPGLDCPGSTGAAGENDQRRQAQRDRRECSPPASYVPILDV
jgi:hypothetical protein